MGLNFRKSIKIADGVKLNLSKGGVSVSVGKKGIHQTISTSGKATTTVGIPGTGIYYTKSKKVGSGDGLLGGLLGGDSKKSTAKKTTTKKSATTTKKATTAKKTSK